MVKSDTFENIQNYDFKFQNLVNILII